MPALQKIIDIQKVGRFEKLNVPGSLRFSQVTLFFGENGWGKSTLADILRSLTRNQPGIIRGRETLATGGRQKVILLVDGQQSAFDGSAWTGPRPRVAVFDQVFINENVYSGDSVSHDHLKRQYGLVVGAEGVALIGRIQTVDKELKEVGQALKEKEGVLQATAATLGLPRMSASDFADLTRLEYADNVIAEKEREVRRATEKEQIRAASLPQPLPVPTPAADLTAALVQSVDGVATDLHRRLQDHIARHAAGRDAPPHEAWLEAGLAFDDTQDCPYCGQELHDRSLIDLYRDYFSEAYKALASEVKQRRQTLERYGRGEFRQAISTRTDTNRAAIGNLKTLTGEGCEATLDIEALSDAMEAAAAALDRVFQQKQEDLITPVAADEYENLARQWDSGRVAIVAYNQEIATYGERIEGIRRAQAGVNLDSVRNELAVLQARKKRYDAETAAIVANRQTLMDRQKALKDGKDELRDQLTAHTKRVTEGLGTTINAYLDRLGAGFQIDYQPPNYRGKEPAAEYAILINKTPVPPRADDIAGPSFKNTLSSGDKSVLALALFLATVNTDPHLAETIVVFDDPFTSMDEFRRTFTVNEINKLTNRAAQVFVFSHELGFLRLLWDRIDQGKITSCAIQTGAPGMASLATFDLEQATRPRNETERMKMIQFIDATEGDPGEIRALLRKVLEHFYRNGDPELFDADEMLEGIIRKIEAAPADYRYKGALDDLKDINFYTRNFHHAPVHGSVTENTPVEELKTYCRRVRELTRGSP
ncbi:ATP-binding cassette domain-containing protein [Sinorhizobium meliloti]|uniref:AAA family ATPase n=1 Tax=Rhizobium meliloti TaxID=382 RepID=UPI000FD95D66|nr:AAA family ATPase [Sinorhizobium meliloti]MDW9502241.1 AAA family ATPase [Sinorhizobium meliloti]RVL73555.1 ATP-binding cassette domain-containing protein [Sinorhizobium meliloti]